jgi:LPS O-antigen subunit length determinant protein (WzzB/FepE family)
MAQDLQEKKFSFDAFDLIRFTWSKKWILIGISAIALIASALLSYTIKPKFKSTVIMYPVSPVSVAKNLVELQVSPSDDKDLLSFGKDDETERLIQILNSNYISDYIIEKFSLWSHYGIDPMKTGYARTKLMAMYKGNVHVRRTEYSSVEISVMDYQPQVAADIANAISSYVDTVFYKIKYDRAKSALTIVEDEYLTSQRTIHALTDTIDMIRANGIQDYFTQTESINEGYADAINAGNAKAAKIFDDKLKILSKYGGKYLEISEKMTREIARCTLLKAKYSSAKVNLENTLTNVFIVDKAFPAEKKTTPKRMTIVLLSTISTFIFSLLALIIYENLKERS